MERNLYLNIQSRQEALAGFLSAFDHIKPEKEVIKTEQSLGRMTYEAVYARYSSPSYNSSAMDGIAVVSAHTGAASEENPLVLEPGRDYVEVDTGDMICPPYDAVIMAEDLIETDAGYRIIAPTHPFAHVRAVGEDLVAREMVLPSHHVITPVDVSVLLSAGIAQVAVVKKPLAAVIPTGDEMITYDEAPEDGKIFETNSYMFENLIKEHQGEVKRYPIIRDHLETIQWVLLDAVKTCDLVIINAGSSAGRDDYTVHAVKALGKVYTHGVAIKPGKPVILGEILGKPVIGLPGYPVSAYITFMEFIVPLLSLYTAYEKEAYTHVSAKLTKTVMSSLKYEEYVRVKLGLVDGALIAAPLSRGAGAAMSLVRAHGFCVIPRNSEGVLAHETVDVKLTKNIGDISKTLVIIGSHDIILDAMDDIMNQGNLGVGLSSTHVGSLSGLVALKKMEAHLAPCHLLDAATGTYNKVIVKEMFPDEKMVIIKGVRRRQGLIVPKGNPKNIRGLSDLARATYVNRQRGAGTRVLLDYGLQKEGLSSEAIAGYDHEVTTHMSVAVAVQRGNADTGMGIYSCARALDLDFVDVAFEEYDFVTYERFLELPGVRAFLSVLTSEAFVKRLEDLGGYSWEEIGKIVEVE